MASYQEDSSFWISSAYASSGTLRAESMDLGISVTMPVPDPYDLSMGIGFSTGFVDGSNILTFGVGAGGSTGMDTAERGDSILGKIAGSTALSYRCKSELG